MELPGKLAGARWRLQSRKRKSAGRGPRAWRKERAVGRRASSELHVHPAVVETAVEAERREAAVLREARGVVRGVELVRVDVEHVVRADGEREVPVVGVGQLRVRDPLRAEVL